MVQIARVLVGLTVVAFAAPAFAEGPAHKTKLPAEPTPATGLSSAFKASVALVASEQPVKAEESRLPPKARHLPAKKCPVGSSCSYHKMLAYLVITRDIQVPGAPDMAVRLLPTSSALGGGSHSRIVVRPRVKGGHYGVDVAARF